MLSRKSLEMFTWSDHRQTGLSFISSFECSRTVQNIWYWFQSVFYGSRCVPAENSLLRFASEDKTQAEDFLLGRSLSQNRRKTERRGSPTHYTLIPALQMEVSLSTSSSDSASLYHVSPSDEKSNILLGASLKKNKSTNWAQNPSACRHSALFLTWQVFERSSLLSRSKKKSKGRSVSFKVLDMNPNMSRRVFWPPTPPPPPPPLSVCSVPLQLKAPCLQSASDVFPAGTWVRATARAGCGKRRMLKHIFHRSGRSTGSSWKTPACTGTWMRRCIYSLNSFFERTNPRICFHDVTFWFHFAFACHRMRRQRASSASQSLRSTGPLSAGGSCEYFFSSGQQTSNLRLMFSI